MGRKERRLLLLLLRNQTATAEGKVAAHVLACVFLHIEMATWFHEVKLKLGSTRRFCFASVGVPFSFIIIRCIELKFKFDATVTEKM